MLMEAIYGIESVLVVKVEIHKSGFIYRKARIVGKDKLEFTEVHMGNFRLAEIAKETLKIAKQRYYYLDGKKIELTKINGMYSYDDVFVLDEDKLNEIENDEDDFFETSFYASNGANFCAIFSATFSPSIAAEVIPPA